jgi:hypothetical protein
VCFFYSLFPGYCEINYYDLPCKFGPYYY